MRQLLLFTLAFFLLSCEGTDEIYIEEQPADLSTCENRIISSGKYYEKDNQQFLWAGKDTTTHFNVTDWTLNACNLKYGLGRETFHALTSPQYSKLSSEHDNIQDDHQVVIIRSGNNVKAYPLGILKNYELVNEVVNGVPVMVVYCFLADLVSVYKRSYNGKTLTFAVSGYTYKDPNNYAALESFILWDRNSESLWWPINDKGVSGEFKGINMEKYDRTKWRIISMKQLRLTYPNALVLKNNQVL